MARMGNRISRRLGRCLLCLVQRARFIGHHTGMPLGGCADRMFEYRTHFQSARAHRYLDGRVSVLASGQNKESTTPNVLRHDGNCSTVCHADVSQLLNHQSATASCPSHLDTPATREPDLAGRRPLSKSGTRTDAATDPTFCQRLAPRSHRAAAADLFRSTAEPRSPSRSVGVAGLYEHVLSVRFRWMDLGCSRHNAAGNFYNNGWKAS